MNTINSIHVFEVLLDCVKLTVVLTRYSWFAYGYVYLGIGMHTSAGISVAWMTEIIFSDPKMLVRHQR
jgi:hypothetical protein